MVKRPSLEASHGGRNERPWNKTRLGICRICLKEGRWLDANGCSRRSIM
jgi:hypothetical protein